MGLLRRYGNQNYKNIRTQLALSDELFVDPLFPPGPESLFFGNNQYPPFGVQWKRPGDIAPNPRLFVEGGSSQDICQGILGNCWFVAACSALTHHESLLKKVIPNAAKQDWTSNRKYCGIFHFRFWRFGEWTDVVIDDFLPCTPDGRLIYTRSNTANEFWSALLEKAFAKLNGCYEVLSGGSLSEALVELSGGVAETINITNRNVLRCWGSSVELFQEIQSAFDNKALMAAAIRTTNQHGTGNELSCGLVKGHSYAITSVQQIELDNARKLGVLHVFDAREKIFMIRLHNPWGEREWNGAWSDSASEWSLVTKQQRKKLGLTFREDGEFWMTWDDFCRHFTDISICHIINTNFLSWRTHYVENDLFGSWVLDRSRGHITDRAGGCPNFKQTALCNPQFVFNVGEDAKQSLLLSLSQEDVRHNVLLGLRHKTIGMCLFQVEDNRMHRLHEIGKIVATSEYVNSKSVFLQVKNLTRGRYVVMPTTFMPGCEGRFLLRTFLPPHFGKPQRDFLSPDSNQQGPLNLFRLLMKDLCDAVVVPHSLVGKVRFFSSKDKSKYQPAVATRLTVVGVDSFLTCNAYCVVHCEKKVYRSVSTDSTADAKWNFRLLFLRQKPEQPITIEVWNSHLLKDTFLGCVTLKNPVTNDNRRYEMEMESRDGDPLPGWLTLEMASFNDLSRL